MILLPGSAPLTKPPLGGSLNYAHPLAKNVLFAYFMRARSDTQIWDQGPWGMHGTLTSGATVVAGAFGRELKITPVGNHSYVSVPYDSHLDPASGRLTLIARVKSTGGTGTLNICQRHYPTNMWGLSAAGGLTGGFNIFDGSWHSSTPNSFVNISNDQKYHTIAGTYDGANSRTYIDGALQVTTAYSVALPTCGNALDIGCYFNDSIFFDGYIEYLLGFDACLTQGQIQRLGLAPYALLQRRNALVGSFAAAAAATGQGNFFPFF